MPDSPTPQTLLRCMDCSDPEDIAGFEQGFYLGFEESTHNRIIRWLWIWDEQAHRLRTRVPYEDQRIWISASGSPPDTGIAVRTPNCPPPRSDASSNWTCSPRSGPTSCPSPDSPRGIRRPMRSAWWSPWR